MSERLKPPWGYSSWLEYAVACMGTRSLFLESEAGDSPWGRTVQREEMRAAARAELARLHDELEQWKREATSGVPTAFDGEPIDVEFTSELRERLAEYAHDAWSGWMRYLFSKAEIIHESPGGDTAHLCEDLAGRWMRQMNTPYPDLPEGEKESDRAEADRMLAIIEESATSGSHYAVTAEPEE